MTAYRGGELVGVILEDPDGYRIDAHWPLERDGQPVRIEEGWPDDD